VKKLKYIILAAIALAGSEVTTAQFSLSGEFRPRTEVSHGYKSLDSEKQDASTVMLTVTPTFLK